MKIREQKGITLIALVVTIIVLLILAGISIGAITGDNGIIKQAQNAKDDTQYQQWEEQIDTAIIDAESKNRDTTMDDVIEELINKKVINDESQVDKETGTITTNEPSYVIEDKLADYVVIYAEDTLKAGDYVNYVDKNGTTRLCCVLWDKSSGYGTQIITMDTVEDVTLGDNDPTVTGDTNFEKAKNSYNNAITTLNEKAMNYLNTTYASDARCVGSVPNDKNSEATDYYISEDSYMSPYNGLFKNGDNNFRLDRNQMLDLRISKIGKTYWLASRRASNETGTANAFYIYVVSYDSPSGYETTDVLAGVRSEDGTTYCYSSTYGLRPVFTLKSEAQITGGEGTEENPYTLGI